MALTPRLDLRQTQQLVMTPQLQQAIKLLQLSNIEIQDFVAEEVEKNPLLELADPNAPSSGEETHDYSEGAADHAAISPTEGDTGLVSSDESFTSGADPNAGKDGPLDIIQEETSYNNDARGDNNSPLQSYSDMAGGSHGDDRSLDQTLKDGDNLHDMLTRQMAVVIEDPTERLVATHLIDLVDPAGYITSDDVIDMAGRLGIKVSEIEDTLFKLQTLEPTGVFARDLQECLSLQLKELNHYDPLMQKLLENLDLLAKRDMAGLKKVCGADSEDLSDMIDEIRTLNPKPGLAFEVDTTQPVAPDILITKSSLGSWTVELNTETLPRVLVNEAYVTEIKDGDNGKETKVFVNECLQQASWLVKALDQRAKTILKVATELVKKQEMFFEHGVRHMKPLILKDIADEIDMHESTVSRVTNNKFMATPRGMFELKYFFSSAIQSADGGTLHAAESVKSRIKNLTDNENPKKILSDDKLVILLKSEGIDIARRTVAKYREAQRIPSSVQRRRMKNMAS